MNRRRIVIGVAAASGVAVLSMAAVQMSGGAPVPKGGVQLAAAPVAAVRAAGAVTASARTAEVDTIVTMTTPPIAAKGASPAVPSKTATMHGTGLFDFSRDVGKVDLTTAVGAIQEVLTPGALYVRSAPQAAAVKGWYKSDTSRLSDGNLVLGGSTDPGIALAMLGGVQSDVKLVGQEKVRDVPVAHYQGTLDLGAAVAAAAPAATSGTAPAATPGTAPVGQAAAANTAADRKALSNAARSFLTPKIPFDAYLDGDGRLRRFVARFTYVVPGPSRVAIEVTSSTDLFGFGIPVVVSTPTAAATTPARPAAGTPSPSRSGHK